MNCLRGPQGKEMWVASRSWEWSPADSSKLEPPSYSFKKMNPANNQQAQNISSASGEYRSPVQSPDVSLLTSWTENPAPPHLDFWLQSEVSDVLIVQSCLTLCDPMDCSPSSSSVHGHSPGKNTGVGCHSLLRGSSWPRDRTRVSCTAGIFFTCSDYKTRR